MALHTRILLGLSLGALAGVAVNLGADGSEAVGRLVAVSTEPVGRMWLNALVMVVIPLILSTLSCGVAGLGSLRRLGRISVRTVAGFLTLTALSAALGLLLMNLVSPGRHLPADVTARLMDTYRSQTADAMGLAQGGFGVDLLVRIIPRNPVAAAVEGNMLGVIFFSIMLGVGLTAISAARAKPLQDALESLGHVTVAIIELVMRLAPIGVFCLIFSVTARFGLGILEALLGYVLTVLAGLVLFQTVAYPVLLALVVRCPPLRFMRAIQTVILTAFSTSSSNATLPTTLRTAEEVLGIPREIAGFVLPLGATLNMNGTALFEGCTVLFLAQVFGVHLTLAAQLIVVLMAVLTAVGTAGVPGGSIPLLMMVLGMVGVPVEGIAIILGVDRILDMCRTVLNVSGDLVTAAMVARFEEGWNGSGIALERDR